jgi:hypothetical protein
MLNMHSSHVHGASMAEWLRSLTWDHRFLTAVGSILTWVEIIHVRKPSWASLRKVGGSTQVPARPWNNAWRGTWGLPPPIKAGKKIDEKFLAGHIRMTRLECTVAHMGFPAATLNKHIKKKNHMFIAKFFKNYQSLNNCLLGMISVSQLNDCVN